MAKFSNINISLQSKTLTDNCTCTTAEVPTIGASLDFSSLKVINGIDHFVVDSYRLNKDTGLYEINATNSIEDKLNSDISISDVGTGNTADQLFNSLFRASEIYDSFDDYKPTGLVVKDTSTNKYVCNETYASGLQKIFGWTSIIPTLVINVFERNGYICAIQRGKEDDTNNPPVNITGYCGPVVYEYSKMNLLFSSDKKYYLIGDNSDTQTDDSVDNTDPNTYLSGQFTDNSGQQTLEYRYGLLTAETFASTDGTINSSAKYSYSTIYPPANLLLKTLTHTEIPVVDIPSDLTGKLPYRVVTKIVNESKLINTISTNNKDLVESSEDTKTTTTGYNITDAAGTTVPFSEEETHKSTTIYSDMGQGQWSVTTYKDNKITGSQIVTGNPGAKASPYSIKQNSTMQSRRGKHVLPSRVELSGKFAGAMNINVSDKDTISRVASAIESLNGKTQELVRLTYHGDTLIDFTNKITYMGNTYFLDSNNITVDEQGVRQALTLLRWY